MTATKLRMGAKRRKMELEATRTYVATIRRSNRAAAVELAKAVKRYPGGEVLREASLDFGNTWICHLRMQKRTPLGPLLSAGWSVKELP